MISTSPRRHRRIPTLAAAAIAAVSLGACSGGASTAPAGSPVAAGASPTRSAGTVGAPRSVAGVVGPAAAKRATDWPTYHHDRRRSGTSDTIKNVHSAPRRVWDTALDGAVYASPIIAQGAKIVVTENNTIYRLSRDRVVWHHHVGAAVPGSSLPCGNIDPSGITGTPVYDPATSTVVFVALLDHPIRHVAYGYDPISGARRWERVVDVPADVSGITPDAMQERGALLIHKRRVFIPYGGLAGDCSTYRGSVVAVDLDDPLTPPLWHFTVPTSREGGIWAPPGAVANPGGGGILVAVGNGATAETGAYDYSDSVLRVAGQRIRDSFSPTTWRTDNRDDLDLGSQGPTVVGKWIFIAGKSGTGYVLAQGHLGGIGGEVHRKAVCRSFGGTAVSGKVVFVPCEDGIRAIKVGRAGRITILWHAATSIAGSPVLGGGRLWSLDTDAGVLYGLDPATGAIRSRNAVGAVSRFATPALWKHRIFVPTMGGVAAFSWT